MSAYRDRSVRFRNRKTSGTVSSRDTTISNLRDARHNSVDSSWDSRPEARCRFPKSRRVSVVNPLGARHGVDVT